MASSARGDPRPATIPALRIWTGRSGTFRLTPGTTRIVIREPDNVALYETAVVFARDLQELLASRFDVVSQADASSRPGDVSLSLSPADGELGAEGYELDVDQSIRISAPTPDGVFYGTRTLLQLLQQHNDIAFGRARDWPTYRERSLLLDIARRYFPPDWLEQRIREMAYLKMNYLHLHISDNEGFGIESSHVIRGEE